MLSLLYGPTLCNPRDGSPPSSSVKNTLVGRHLLLQGIFLTQGLNLHLLRLGHWQTDILHLSHMTYSSVNYMYHVVHCIPRTYLFYNCFLVLTTFIQFPSSNSGNHKSVPFSLSLYISELQPTYNKHYVSFWYTTRHFDRPWCWERLKAGEGSGRGWDG